MKPESIEQARSRRKREAVRGVVFFALLQVVSAVCFGALCLIPGLPGWAFWIFALLAVLCIVLLIPSLVVLKQRFQEIEGGELDEAGKY